MHAISRSRKAFVVVIGPSCKRGNVFSSEDLPSFCVGKSDDEVLIR